MMLDEMIIHIEYTHSSLTDLIFLLVKSDIYKELSFLYECKKLIEHGTDFPIAWVSSIENSRLLYTKAEKEKLIQLSQVLGASDVKGQINILSVHSKFFESFLIKAQETKNKYSSLIVLCFCFFGCLIFVLLL